YDSERTPIVKMGKSLVVARHLPAGHVLGSEDVVMKSPGGGIPPYDLPKVLGRITRQPLYEDDFLSYEMLVEPSAELARSRPTVSRCTTTLRLSRGRSAGSARSGSR